MLAELGATVLNADRVGHEVIAAGEPALAEIVTEFGAELLREDGELDRRKLGRRVFKDSKALAALNRITHPRIRRRLEERLEALASHPPRPPIVALEAALLIEAGWASMVDRMVVVVVQPSTQEQRLIAGSGLSQAEARARLRAQVPASRRLRYADYPLNGELPLSELRSQVTAVWQDLLHSTGTDPL